MSISENINTINLDQDYGRCIVCDVRLEEGDEGKKICDDCEDCEETAPENGECDKCNNKLTGGDNNKWGKEHGDYKTLCDTCYDIEEAKTTCDVCKTETTMDATFGCCVNEHLCRTNNMCAECGEYDEDEDEWTCNKCLKPTIIYTGVRRKRIYPSSC